MMPATRNPGEYEEHFVFQDPDHPYRRAVVKQGLADVRRSHRLDVHRNAYESQVEQIYKTCARSFVEKLSIKCIFNVHTVLASLPATRVNPELCETKFGTRAQQQGASVHVGQQDVEDASWSSCSRAEQASLLQSRRPCPNSCRLFSESSSSDVVGMFLPATGHHCHGFLKCRNLDLAGKSGLHFCFLALNGRSRPPSSSKLNP